MKYRGRQTVVGNVGMLQGSFVLTEGPPLCVVNEFSSWTSQQSTLLPDSGVL